MKEMQTIIDTYQLEPHQEGGYFKQIFAETVNGSTGERPDYTSIYFLLTPESPSHFHRLTCDEIWYYHAGSPLTVHCIYPDGTYQPVQLGLDADCGQAPCFRVPAGTIFGSTVESDYAFVSCACVPGFMYQDFELFTKNDLLSQYPEHRTIIEKLTLDQLPEIDG